MWTGHKHHAIVTKGDASRDIHYHHATLFEKRNTRQKTFSAAEKVEITLKIIRPYLTHVLEIVPS